VLYKWIDGRSSSCNSKDLYTPRRGKPNISEMIPAPPHERSKEEAMLAAEVDLLPPAFCEAFIGAVGGIDVRSYMLKLTIATTLVVLRAMGRDAG
jgi:hypothetical protein